MIQTNNANQSLTDLGVGLGGDGMGRQKIDEVDGESESESDE
tara:strand:+ start:575 stop:700 length:126 start_codon:yes stop_codon:yes gene_type:complete